MQSIELADIKAETRVFVRADIDNPIHQGRILDTYRLEQCLPTLGYLKQKRAKIIIAGHIGKPNGSYNEELSTKQLIPYFNEKLGENNFELLENLRFDPREETNDETFAVELARMADIYVNESFATCHRKHASIVGIPKLLPAYAGLRLIKEVEALSKVLKNPQRPLVAVVGGDKIESKKPAILKFLEISDAVLVGGILGINWIGQKPKNLYLATDFVNEAKNDVGPRTIQTFSKIIQTAKTIIWAGPIGMYTIEEYAKGTYAIAKAIAESRAFSIVGGGDTVAAIKKAGLENKFNFISTGGGAMLEFLVKGNLPGLETLDYHG